MLHPATRTRLKLFFELDDAYAFLTFFAQLIKSNDESSKVSVAYPMRFDEIVTRTTRESDFDSTFRWLVRWLVGSSEWTIDGKRKKVWRDRTVKIETSNHDV